MPSSLVLTTMLVVVLATTSLQQSVPQATRGPPAPQWGYQGLGTGQGFRGQGYPASDARYGFDIIDAPDRYGYVSNYPGGRTSFFLLGPNRGPGQQSWRGSNMGSSNTPQPGAFRPGMYRPGSFSSAAYRTGGDINSLGNGNGDWQRPGRF